MKVGLLAAATVAVLLVVAAASYLVGHSSAPTSAEARDAQQEAYKGAFHASEEQAALRARKVAFARGQRDGRQAGSDNGDNDAADEIAASQPAPAPSAPAPAPGTVDQFGIVRPAPGVSPEYDNCIAQGGTPSPDGCLP
jgi:hypothetical protein